MSLPEQMAKIVAEEVKNKHIAMCKMDAAFKLFEASTMAGDAAEAENQRRIIHALQDIVLDSIQIVFSAIAREG